MGQSGPSDRLVAAIESLRSPQYNSNRDLTAAAEFQAFRRICEEEYGALKSSGSADFALSIALRSLGYMSRDGLGRALPSKDAAIALDAAFRAQTSARTYLCPLDLAGDIPQISFGPNSIARFKASELAQLANADRLLRYHPKWLFDVDRFSEFSWLVIKEEAPISPLDPSQRSVSFLDFGQDFGRIDPHPSKFPLAVEAALSALLLAPWEDWIEIAEIDWRAFRIPWVFVTDEDLFHYASVPPSPDTLSWEPDIIQTLDGDEIEREKPTALPVTVDATELSQWVNDNSVATVNAAMASPLFETPIFHFLLRAFTSDGIDSFLAHLVVLEAAVGLKIDFEPKARIPVPGKGNLGAKFRISARLAGLLGSKSDADNFNDLYELRSEYLHGRLMSPIGTPSRMLARSMARRTVVALVAAATAQAKGMTRDRFLDQFLTTGATLL
jgi:hypothetical protein